jgi:glycosyltransferase involved in cell wall biosynthesis
MNLFVVVPFYNEARGISATLEALAEQCDREFTLVLVDNGSTDRGGDVARCFAAGHPDLETHVIYEPTKGTGAAADTGFRYAIGHGATHIARTDADCLPNRHWVRRLKCAFAEGLEFVAGKIVPRLDEVKLTPFERILIPLLVSVAERFGRVHRRGPRFHYPYILAAGNNLAITSELYVRAGGFPRTSIEHVHEDRELSERVRTLTPNGGFRRDVVVANSVRRAKRYGYARTILWYVAHRGRASHMEVDVR